MSNYDYREEAEHRQELKERFEKRRQRRESAGKLIKNALLLVAVAAAAAAAAALIFGAVTLISKEPWKQDIAGNSSSSESTAKETLSRDTMPGPEPEMSPDDEVSEEPEPIPVGDMFFVPGYEAVETEDTVRIPKMNDEEAENYIGSDYVVLINESTGEIVAEKDAKVIINPASMTKVLTVLVAAEHLTEEDLDKKFKITREITDYVYRNDCSAVNFSVGEKVPVRDLFFGTILPSGADAALGLAEYVAGTQEEFVVLMNEKLEELGLSETAHFTNCIGLYNEDHYCTVYDMAMILKAAVENDFCREVLSAHTYTTAKTKKHEDGITISNWFLRRIEDHPCGGLVLCGKTGYVSQSGNCAASYEISESGAPYICVTAMAAGGWRCIFDHVAVYKAYAK